MAPLVFLWIEEGDTRDSIVSEIKDNKIYTFIMGAAEKFVSNGRVDQD